MTLPEIIDRIKYRWNRSKTIPLAVELLIYYTVNTKFLAGVTLMALVCWVAH